MKLELTVYYSGRRPIPYLEHPKFGKFPYDEVDCSFTLPRVYAEHLVKHSPLLFSFKRNDEKFYEDMASKPGGANKLAKYARGRGIETKGLKAKDIIVKLLEQDNKQANLDDKAEE